MRAQRWIVLCAIGLALLLWRPVAAPARVQVSNAQISNNNNRTGLHVGIDTNRYHNFAAALGATGFGIRENTGAMEVKDAADAWLNILGVFATAPTISAGFGTSPSVTAHNGPTAFRVDIGGGGTATSGTIGLPAADNGWNCDVTNITATAANAGDARTVQTSSTTTTAVIENQAVVSGVALVWTASDILAVSCFAF